MPDIKSIFAANREWAKRMCESDPEFFDRLADEQKPEYLWIGCSDSRAPANQITGLQPGEVFVHRNIANIARIDDPNCQAVIEYAVDVLGVKSIMVCGHYGCGGVLAALRGGATGLTGEWVSCIVNLRKQHADALDALATEAERHDRLCELNVIDQVRSLSESRVIRDAWARGQTLRIHGWIYSIRDGLLKDLEASVGGPAMA